MMGSSIPVILILTFVAGYVSSEGTSSENHVETYTTAFINLTYRDESGQIHIDESDEIAQFGEGPESNLAGSLVLIKAGNDNSGCFYPWHNVPPPNVKWIALVRRGACSPKMKVDHAFKSNASGIIIYNDRSNGSTLDKIKFSKHDKNITTLLTYKWKGEQMAHLLEKGYKIWITIKKGNSMVRYPENNRTSVLFVSIAFVALLAVVLTWLVFYYVQKFRHTYLKDRLTRRLSIQAKKAVSKIPTKTLSESDSEIQDLDNCAVCIESYTIGELVRVLPCRHIFHVACIDKWLLDHRTCPMCKLDILKQYGFYLTGSQESILMMEEGDGGFDDNSRLNMLSQVALIENMPIPPEYLFPPAHERRSGSDRPTEISIEIPEDSGMVAIDIPEDDDNVANNSDFDGFSMMREDFPL